MSDTATTWKLIHAERASLADTLEGLEPEQWAAPSLCAGWSVQLTAGHVVAGAEQTPLNFLKAMVVSGMRFNVMTARDARRLGSLAPKEIVDRIRARTTTTNRPPAPVGAMLGEVVVHGEDIRRPLRLSSTVSTEATIACLDLFKVTSFPIGAKKRIAGLRLVASDASWSHGAGPEVTGPALSLVMAMAGRSAGLDELNGDGVALLRSRP